MQQVNLYLPEFHPRREPMNAQHMGLFLLAVVLLMIIWSVFSGIRTSNLEAELAAEQAELNAVQTQVQELTAQLPARAGMNTEEQVAQMRAEVQRREQILLLISRQNMGNSDGFSAQLQTMARQSLDDLSLSQFALKAGGNYVELAGRVRRPEVVPVYLQRLRQDQSFSQVRFGVLNVAREPDDEGPGLTFSVRQAEQEQRNGR